MSGYVFIVDDAANVVEVIYDGVNAQLLREVNNRLTVIENEFNTHVNGNFDALAELESDINSLNSIVAAQGSVLTQEISDRELSDFNMTESFSGQLIAQQAEYTAGILLEAERAARPLPARTR
jgi:hypothetical protein